MRNDREFNPSLPILGDVPDEGTDPNRIELVYVRLDDRGDLGVYCWRRGEFNRWTDNDIMSEAEDYAQNQGWKLRESEDPEEEGIYPDTAIFPCSDACTKRALDVLFFYHRGHVCQQEGETYKEANWRCAKEYAADEQWAKDNGVEYEETESEFPWDGDDPLPDDCVLSDFTARVRCKPCPCCGHVRVERTSLGSCAYVPGDGYDRVVRAELAQELKKLIEK
jgi:hypothetical protein